MRGRANTRRSSPSSCRPCSRAYARVSAEADLVLIEGAGSAAEINLRAGDIANMGFARAAQCPVALIGDIDRGGHIRPNSRNQGGARARGRRHDRRLHRQQVPRRRKPVRRRHGDARGAHRLARARPCAVLRREPSACPRKTRLALARSKPAPDGQRHDRRADAGADRQFRRVRPAAHGALRAACLRPPRRGHCPSPISSSCPAARRRSRTSISFSSRAGTSIFSPMRGAAGGCSESAAATRCSGRASPTLKGSKGRPAKGRRPLPARGRDGADRREDPARGRGRARRRRRAVSRL